jgi:hypothetical protein
MKSSHFMRGYLTRWRRISFRKINHNQRVACVVGAGQNKFKERRNSLPGIALAKTGVRSEDEMTMETPF